MRYRRLRPNKGNEKQVAFPQRREVAKGLHLHRRLASINPRWARRGSRQRPSATLSGRTWASCGPIRFSTVTDAWRDLSPISPYCAPAIRPSPSLGAARRHHRPPVGVRECGRQDLARRSAGASASGHRTVRGAAADGMATDPDARRRGSPTRSRTAGQNEGMANGLLDGKALARHSREIKPGLLHGSSALAAAARTSLGVSTYFPLLT